MSRLARAADADPARADRAAAIPWYVWTTVAASTAIMVACQWDMSWHRSVGRDTFFSPPHCLLYGGALLACGSSGYLILRTTFSGRSAPGSVRIWGFRGPLGAFVAAWGGIAMLTSGPFDDWWHGAYGLDIVIQSPPHMLLAGGALSIMFGALLLAIAQANRGEPYRRWAAWLIVYSGSVLFSLLLGAFMEDTFNYLQHSVYFYFIVALVAPGVLACVAVSSRLRWGATLAASLYTCFTLALILVLPLFPAQAKLGPVMQPITHFVPPPFPLLVVVGAIPLDWARAGLSERALPLRAVASGAGFFSAFLLAQWPFASFLHSPWASHRLFAADAFAYFQAETSLAVRKVFLTSHSTPSELWVGFGMALMVAIFMTGLGLTAGAWLRTLQR